MAHLLKTLPLFLALAAGPAFAAEPAPTSGHHPDAAAPADSKPAMSGCPMMDGKMPAGAGPMTGMGPDGKMMDGKMPAGAGPMMGTGPDGKMMGGKMMMEGKDMPCMSPPAVAAGSAKPPGHDHPDGAPPK
jgi:hypothetical protein